MKISCDGHAPGPLDMHIGCPSHTVQFVSTSLSLQLHTKHQFQYGYNLDLSAGTTSRNAASTTHISVIFFSLYSSNFFAYETCIMLLKIQMQNECSISGFVAQHFPRLQVVCGSSHYYVWHSMRDAPCLPIKIILKNSYNDKINEQNAEKLGGFLA